MEQVRWVDGRQQACKLWVPEDWKGRHVLRRGGGVHDSQGPTLNLLIFR